MEIFLTKLTWSVLKLLTVSNSFKIPTVLISKSVSFICSRRANSSFISALPGYGTILPGSSQDVNVTFDAANLNSGDYSADISIFSNDPDEPEVNVPVSLTVNDPDPEDPDILVDPEELYEELNEGESSTQTMTIYNDGGSDLEWSINDATGETYSRMINNINIFFNIISSALISLCDASSLGK